jgi:aquaporin Z
VVSEAGAALFAAGFPTLGIGFAGVALAFGLTLLTMAFAIGHISGCHLNPAVSLGLVVGRRFPASELLPYVIAQVAGAIAAAGVLFVIASGKARFRRPLGICQQRIRPAFSWRLLSARVLHC